MPIMKITLLEDDIELNLFEIPLLLIIIFVLYFYFTICYLSKSNSNTKNTAKSNH